MPEQFVTDACSLIAFFREEEGVEKVTKLFKDAVSGEAVILLHKITLTEVLYDRMRSGNTKDAGQIIDDINRLPLLITDILTDDFIKLVAHHKVAYKVSFADCFVLALAQTKNAAIITSDHHEFDAIEKIGELKFHWIR